MRDIMDYERIASDALLEMAVDRARTFCATSGAGAERPSRGASRRGLSHSA